jgi:CDP-diacylglycerol--glycerol-3-phosphate 3-phosphatidyltransferase
MNLPNKLTLSRVIMIPFFVAALMAEFPYHRMVAGIIFIAASLTDLLDGYLARRDHLVTTFGKFIDPLADKLLVCSALICFVEQGLLPAWMVIIIISREFIISGFRLIASDKGVVIAAGMSGKIKTVCQMVMAVLLIFHFEGMVFQILETIFIWASLLMTVESLVVYLIQNKDILDLEHM